MSRNSYVLLVVVLMVSLSGLAQAPPSADTYVTSARPGANFGNSLLLPVQSGTSSYVRLNLGTFPRNAVIAKATLRLYVNAVTAAGSFDAYQVEDVWSEKGLNFANAPALGASATGGRPILITSASVNQFILVDITTLVQGWLNGAIPNYGVALALVSPGGSFSFDSKESVGTGHQPELEVVFSSMSAASPTNLETSTIAGATPRGAQTGNSDPYVDNGTALQVGANFNIDGSGSAATLNATSQYQLGGVPVLGTNGGQSLFLGTQAGQSNTGNENTFLGIGSGHGNTGGNFNTFVGTGSGIANTTGAFNTFIGRQAGLSNTTGQFNSFLGSNAGNSNTTGSYNFFLGGNAGYSNTTGAFNVFVGTGAGGFNTTGQSNTMFGNTSGAANTTGSYNAFFGGSSGVANTTGSANVFFGVNAGYNNTTGSNNLYVGVSAGMNADPAATQNVYVGTQGAPAESNTIRVGDPSNQTAAFIAGISGASTNSGAPVFIDSTGKLGTGGGAVSFTQITGTLSNPQFTGTYSNPVTLSNTTNIFDGSFAGNGSGLSGVASGLFWPVVPQSADYSIQISDFATPTTHGNYIVHTGTAHHIFTLPNPPPPNGSCVAIGNFAIGAGANVFLSVNSNGLSVDGGTTFPTHPRRSSYLYCSDGSGYWRFGQNQNGVSEIGPWLITGDTGAVNAYVTTFVNGLDFGLNSGTMLYLMPINANTSPTPTLNINGLGAHTITKLGNQPLAPGDMVPGAVAHLIYYGPSGHFQLLNPQTNQGTVTAVTATPPLVSSGGVTPNLSCPACVTTLSGTTGSIGGSALTAGNCTSGTAAVTGATVGHPVSVSASDGTLPSGFIILSAAVTSSNTVTVQLCAAASVTPLANTYNVTTQ